MSSIQERGLAALNVEREGSTDSLSQSWDTPGTTRPNPRGAAPALCPERATNQVWPLSRGPQTHEHHHWLHDAIPSKDLKFPEGGGPRTECPDSRPLDGHGLAEEALVCRERGGRARRSFPALPREQQQQQGSAFRNDTLHRGN